MTSLEFEPLIPIAWWLSLAVAAAVLLVLYGRDCGRRLGAKKAARIVALMALAVALPLVILLNPQWHERVPPPAGKSLVTVLVDASSSMSTPDAGDGASRFAAARELSAAISEQLADRYDLEVRLISGSETPLDGATATGAPDGPFTDLAGGLTRVLEADRPQGQAVVLLSDGIHNAGGGEAAVLEAAQQASVLAVPIYTKTLGGNTTVRDLAVEVQTPQDLAFIGQTIPLRVDLVAHGLSGSVARVSLWRENEEAEHREVALSEGVTEIEFPLVHTQSGLSRYEVRAERIGDEATDVNNTSTYMLRVIDEPIRVLLLEGKPYWDTKFLLRTLASDPSIELVSVVRLTDGRYLQRTLDRPAAGTSDGPPAEGQAADEALPPAAERSEAWKILTTPGDVFSDDQALASYQVIILGRDADGYLSDDVLAGLKRWLARDGGSLVCFRGTPTVQVSQRLGSLLPVRSESARETRFHMSLTEAGKQLRWIPTKEPGGSALTGLPTLATRSQASHPQPLTVVWAVGESAGGTSPEPVVTSMPYGTGRVVVLEGAGMWRWAFMAPQYEQQASIYANLWQSLMRWLVSNTGLLPTQTWALRSDKVRFSNTEQATASLLVRPGSQASDTLEIELAGTSLDAPRRVTPTASGDELGAFRVLFGKLPEGRYTATIVGSSEDDTTARAAFEVRSNVDEVLRLEANPNLMKQVAVRSGGAGLSAATPDEIATLVDEHLARLRPEQYRTTTAWDRWWVLAGVFALWSVSWGYRRSRGLI